MNNRIHVASAVTAAFGINTLANSMSLESNLIALFAGSIVGSIIPDIDTPKSRIGKILRPISTIIKKTVGHRTFFHSFLFTAIVGIILALFNYSLGIGFVVGMLSHILLDILTPGTYGVAILYPFYKKRMFVMAYKPASKYRHTIKSNK